MCKKLLAVLVTIKDVNVQIYYLYTTMYLLHTTRTTSDVKIAFSHPYFLPADRSAFPPILHLRPITTISPPHHAPPAQEPP